MPIEFNLSHEETVAGWDRIIEDSAPCAPEYDIDGQGKHSEFLTAYLNYQNSFVLNREEQIGGRSIKDINQSNHDFLHKIINFQNESKTSKIKWYFYQIIINSIFALTLIKNPDDPMAIIFCPYEIWKDQIAINRELMINKNKNYGSSWSIMRPEGITDTIHTKIHRITSLLDGEENKFESVKDSFEDIINYCAFCIMRTELNNEG